MDALNLQNIASLGGASVPALGSSAAAGPAAPQMSFANLMANQLEQANSQYAAAQGSVDGLLSGNMDDIHNVVIATAKAELSMQMMLEVRNKLSEQYQELMRMQV